MHVLATALNYLTQEIFVKLLHSSSVSTITILKDHTNKSILVKNGGVYILNYIIFPCLYVIEGH